jgi:hypothetical protein
LDLTKIVIENDAVRDQSAGAADRSPIEKTRSWERQAEDNVVRRLEHDTLMSNPGEVEKILETIVNNLEATNNLDIQPEVRCRVLLTTPLETFTLGHTIVMSRGLLDVVPDEAALAIFIAHELAHIVLGHRVDTSYAFSDRMIFEDSGAMRHFDFHRSPDEETAADQKAQEMLAKSPYKDGLKKSGMFLRSMVAHSEQLPNLLNPLMGSRLARKGSIIRMGQLMEAAPELRDREVDQIAALPLGGRIRMSTWDGRIRLMKSAPTRLISAREKMPFEITPVMDALQLDSRSEASLSRP